MARRLQHLAEPKALVAAERDGTKVLVACGKHVHPKPRMKDDIPTCTRCVNEMRRQWREHRCSSFQWFTTTATNISSGAIRTWVA